MRYPFHFGIVVITILFLLVTFVLGFQNKGLPKKFKNSMIALGFLIGFLSLLEYWIIELAGMTNEVAIGFHYAFRIIDMVLGPSLAYFAASSIFEWSWKRRLLGLLPAVAILVMAILSAFSQNLLFYIDSEGIAHNGPLYFVFYIYVASYFSLFFFSSLKQSKLYQYRHLASLIAIFVFVALAVALEEALPEARVCTLSLAVSLLLYYNYYSDLYLQGDPLTKLLNRRHFENVRLRKKKEYLLVFLDVDDFKAINDTYGHDYGDEVLRQIGGVILERFSKNGLCYRYGGDEFVVILGEGEDVFLNQIKDFTDDLSTMRKGDPRFPYVSYGYHHVAPNEGVTVSAQLADEMMYCQKEANKSKRNSAANEHTKASKQGE